MISSWKDKGIVYVKMEGEFSAHELIDETNKWVKQDPNSYIGYVVDIRGLTKQSIIEQKKAEEQAKKNKTGKPRAMLGNDVAMGALVNIYKKFTGAQGMRYFTDEAQALEWLRNFGN